MAWFYDKISRAEPISFKWPDNARLAVCFHSPFEAWSERQDPASNLYRSMQADMPPLPPNANVGRQKPIASSASAWQRNSAKRKRTPRSYAIATRRRTRSRDRPARR